MRPSPAARAAQTYEAYPSSPSRTPDRSAGARRDLPFRSEAPRPCKACAFPGDRTEASLGDVPLLTFDRYGRLVHRSLAATRLLGAVTPELIELGCQSAVRRALLAAEERASERQLPALEIGIAIVHGHSIMILPLATRSMEGGAVGVVMVRAVAEVASPDRLAALTPRERDVAQLLASGASSKAIAHALGRSIHTVRRHTDRIFAKLGVGSRTQLANVLRR